MFGEGLVSPTQNEAWNSTSFAGKNLLHSGHSTKEVGEQVGDLSLTGDDGKSSSFLVGFFSSEEYNIEGSSSSSSPTKISDELRGKSTSCISWMGIAAGGFSFPWLLISGGETVEVEGCGELGFVFLVAFSCEVAVMVLLQVNIIKI